MVAKMLSASKAYNLGPVTRIPPGEGRLFKIDHKAVAVFRMRDEEVFATQAYCPHEAAPLADGVAGSGKLICPLHACKYDLVTGEPERAGCAPLETYPVSVGENGDLFLNLDGRRLSEGETE